MQTLDKPVLEGVQFRACDVCVALNKDLQPRDVEYCKLCGAWICKPHQGRYDKRALAAMAKIAKWILGGEKEKA